MESRFTLYFLYTFLELFFMAVISSSILDVLSLIIVIPHASSRFFGPTSTCISFHIQQPFLHFDSLPTSYPFAPGHTFSTSLINPAAPTATHSSPQCNHTSNRTLQGRYSTPINTAIEIGIQDPKDLPHTPLLSLPTLPHSHVISISEKVKSPTSA